MLQVGKIESPVHVLNWTSRGEKHRGPRLKHGNAAMPNRFPGSEWQGALELLQGMQDKSIPASVISSLGSPWCLDTGGVARLFPQKQ